MAIRRMFLRGLTGLGIAATALVCSPAARADDASVQAELKTLRDRIAQLEAQVGQNEKKVDQALVNKAVADVLADSQKRGPGGSGHAVAGFDRGFFLASSDGNFLLRPGLQFQFRGVENSNSDGPDGDSQSQSGFAIHRVRFRFDGHVFSPNLTYRLIWDANRQGGAVALLDAFIAYQISPDWNIKVGQYMESWSHERDIGFPFQMAAERTILDTLIGGNLTDRVQGIALTYGGLGQHKWRAEFGFHDGAFAKNTDFRDEVVTGTTTTPNPANFGFGGRLEYKPLGDWEDLRDFTAKGNKQNVLLVGGGFDFTQAGDRDVWFTTVDAHYETASGWSFYGGVIADFIDPGGAAGKRIDWGFVAQASYLFAPSIEGFARYDIIFFDEGSVITGEQQIPEITAGVNYYFLQDRWAMHRLKLTVDVNYLPNGSPIYVPRTSYTPGTEGQFTLRAQLYLQI